MMGFKDFCSARTKNESVVRKGAVTLYASQAKRHGDESVKHYNKAKLHLNNPQDRMPEEQRFMKIRAALEELLNGLISQRSQIGSISAQITASNVLGS